MSNKEDEDGTSSDDSAFRAELEESGFKADTSGLQWMAAQPRVLVSGAYDVIRTAAERARKVMGRDR